MSVLVCARICGLLYSTDRVTNGIRLQAILDKESFKLEDLLNEDDIVQECKALNPRLVTLCVLRQDCRLVVMMLFSS